MNSSKKTPEQTATFIEAVANKQGWVATPDQPFLHKICEGLTRNYQRYGYYLCPCRDGDGEREADRDIICPCVYAKADTAEFGHCFCGLYLSRDFAASGKEPSSIPERRPAQ